MKLLRYGPKGHEKPGLFDQTGAIRDLSAHVGDLAGATLSRASLDRLAARDPDSLPRAGDAPPGLGLGQKPPVYLKGGETMRLGIDGPGAQTRKVRA